MRTTTAFGWPPPCSCYNSTKTCDGCVEKREHRQALETGPAQRLALNTYAITQWTSSSFVRYTYHLTRRPTSRLQHVTMLGAPPKHPRSDLLACVVVVGIRRGSRRPFAQTSFTGPARVFSLLIATFGTTINVTAPNNESSCTLQPALNTQFLPSPLPMKIQVPERITEPHVLDRCDGTTAPLMLSHGASKLVSTTPLDW